MKKVLWELFKRTGELKYYIFMKEVENNEDRKDKSDNNK